MSKVFVVRQYDRAAVVAAAIVHIHETAPVREHRAALEDYLRDEFFDERSRALADLGDADA